MIGTKTESHVRSFFVNYRRRYNLDNALKEFEAEHGPSSPSGSGGANEEEEEKKQEEESKEQSQENGVKKGKQNGTK